MTKQKSPITVRKATEMVYRDMPAQFHAFMLCARVKAKTGRMALMDGTILRRLREAREESAEFNYRCIDNDQALYQKIEAR